MNCKSHYSILLLSIILISCNKEQPLPYDPSLCTTIIDESTYDTIPPDSYYPVYPGSWWNYDDGTTNNATGWFLFGLKTSVGYAHSNECPYKKLDNIYLPKLNDDFFYSRGPVVQIEGFNSSLQQPLYRNQVGLCHAYNRVLPNSTLNEYLFVNVIEVNQNISVLGVNYNDVIITEAYYCLFDAQQDSIKTFQTNYYAKDIGLIMSITTDSLTTSIPDTMNLVNYYIAPF